jgi:hypothetical protein
MSFSNVNETKHRAVHAQISSARHVLATSIIGTVRHILLQLIRVNKIKAIRMVMMVHKGCGVSSDPFVKIFFLTCFPHQRD